MPNIVDTVKRSHRAPMLLLYTCVILAEDPLFILLIWHAATAKAKVLTTLQIMMNPKLWQQWLWSCRLKRLINIFGRHPANYMCVSSWLHFAFIKVCPGLSWSRVNDLIRNSLIFGIFIIVMRWWACSHGRPKTFPIRIWYSLSIGELWVGLCSLLLHLNEFWVLLCLSYGPIISFFFKQYISEMSLLQTEPLTETAFYILIPYSVYSCLLRRQLEKLILSCYLISKTTCNLNPVFNKNRKMPIQ